MFCAIAKENKGDEQQHTARPAECEAESVALASYVSVSALLQWSEVLMCAHVMLLGCFRVGKKNVCSFNQSGCCGVCSLFVTS
jgi:hypothetical protein